MTARVLVEEVAARSQEAPIAGQMHVESYWFRKENAGKTQTRGQGRSARMIVGANRVRVANAMTWMQQLHTAPFHSVIHSVDAKPIEN